MVQNIVAFILHSWVCTYFGCSGRDQPWLCLSPASFLLCSRSCLVEIGMSDFTCAKYLVSLSNCVGQMRHTQRACYWICLYIELIHWSIDPSYISCPALFHLFCLTNQRSRSFVWWLLCREVHSTKLFFSLLLQLDSHFVFETFLLLVLLCSQAWHAVTGKISGSAMFTSTFLEVITSSMQCDLMLLYLFSTLLLSVDDDPICVFRSLFFYSGTSCSKIYVLFCAPYVPIPCWFPALAKGGPWLCSSRS